MFYRVFRSEPVRSASLQITGLGVFRAWLNGCRIGEDWLTPGFNDYDAYLRVYTYDVTGQIAPENRLEVVLGRGWCMSRLGPNSGDPYHWGRTYMLAARLILEYEDGRTEVIETDSRWKCCRSPITMSELYDGEHRDDTLPAGEPVPCREIAADYHLEAPVSPPVREIGILKPTLIHTKKGELLLDFGQNFAGVVRFYSRLDRGRTIMLEMGEVLQDGCFYRDNYLTARAEYRYTSDGCEKWVEPWFCFYGGRYARVTGLETADPRDFEGVVLSSALERTAWTGTGHSGINRLIENACWSQRSNFLDVPTDCPQRDERLGWLGDAQVFAETACFQLDCRAFYRKFMRDMREEQVRYYGGDLPMYVPSLKGLAGAGGAIWADAAVILPWTVYMAYGDIGLLEETYLMMRDYLELRIAEDEALGGTHVRFNAFTFGDWLAQDGITRKSVFGGTNHAFLQGCCYCLAADMVSRAASALGYSQDEAKYGVLSQSIRTAMQDEYVTKGGHLAVDTQTGYVYAWVCGLCPDAEVFRQDFLERLRRDGWQLRTGFAGTPHLLDVLFDCCLEAEAFRMLLSESFPGWLYEVGLGATTIWERWNSLEADGTVSDTGMNSFNHYAYGSVCGTIYSRIAGIRCVSPGYRKVRIEPHPDERLGFCRTVFESVLGRFSVGWEVHEDGRLTVDVSCPSDADVEVVLPYFGEAMPVQLRDGRGKWTYRPTVDLLHPYHAHALILDLIRVPDIAAWMRNMTPNLYALAADPESDVRTRYLDELSWGVPKAARCEAVLLGEWLACSQYTLLRRDGDAAHLADG